MGTTRLKSESKPEMSDSKNQDDVDDEITAVFAEGEPGEDGMSKSWHGSRSARCGTLIFNLSGHSSFQSKEPQFLCRHQRG